MKEHKLNFKVFKELFISTFTQFIDDKGMKMSAALSFYAAFSLGPLLIIIIAIAGFIFGEEAVRGELSDQITFFVGKDSADMIQTIIQGASNVSSGLFASIISLFLLAFGSVGVFIELEESLNIIWGVELKSGRGIWGFIKNRLVSFSMVISAGFLLIVSLIINTVINLLYNKIGNIYSDYLPVSQIINAFSSFIVITLLIALIYKYLPDIIIAWKYAWMGAVITSVMFSLGRYLIGLYLGNSSYSSVFGAAGSLVVLFLWIYYSGIIFFFVAEFTQVYRNKFSETELKPDADGILVPKVTELIEKSMKEIDQKSTEK